MKSVLEVITILIFISCITMLERMDDNNYFDGPVTGHHNISCLNKKFGNNFAATPTIATDAKPLKIHNLQPAYGVPTK